MLNSSKYPAIDYNVSFTNTQFSRLYSDACKFRTKFYNVDDIMGMVGTDPQEFKDLHPIFVIDVSQQSERLKNGVTDIQIKAKFSENVPADTEAYAVVISDRILKFESNGNRMNVIM